MQILSAQISWKDFFFKKVFQWLKSFFHDCQNIYFGVIFGTKNQIYTFLQAWVILMQY